MRIGLVLVMCATAAAGPTKPVKVAGYANVEIPSDHVWDYSGAIAHLASKTAGDETTYTLDVVDAAAKPHPLEIQLPKSLPSPFVSGAQVKVTLAAVGGGPNARGQIAMTDDAGIVVAIGKLPAGWTASTGKQVSVTKGTTDDETSSAVKVTAAGDSVELVEGWATFDLGKHHYAGNGNIGSRVLKVKTPPPDWVGGWMDVAIVRVRG